MPITRSFDKDKQKFPTKPIHFNTSQFVILLHSDMHVNVQRRDNFSLETAMNIMGECKTEVIQCIYMKLQVYNYFELSGIQSILKPLKICKLFPYLFKFILLFMIWMYAKTLWESPSRIITFIYKSTLKKYETNK